MRRLSKRLSAKSRSDRKTARFARSAAAVLAVVCALALTFAVLAPPRDASAQAPKPPDKPKLDQAAQASQVKAAQMRQLYDQAVALFDQGKRAEAKPLFQKVADSKVDLGWWTNRKLRGYLETIAAEEFAAAKKAAAVAVATNRLNDADAYARAGRYADAHRLLNEIKDSKVELGREAAAKLQSLSADVEKRVAEEAKKAEALKQEAAARARKARDAFDKAEDLF
ncbi:MAG: hypothetical protein FJ272_15130, partial [Planctomycetes bacterium]|nr:hypothetical protein [Planctomycetota bacterium]